MQSFKDLTTEKGRVKYLRMCCNGCQEYYVCNTTKKHDTRPHSDCFEAVDLRSKHLR